MQINLYSLEELENYDGKPIIFAQNDLTVSGILGHFHFRDDTLVNDDTDYAIFAIGDGEGVELHFKISQDDLSSGLVTISAHKASLPAMNKSLIYIHKARIELSETQLATPHTYSASSGYWIPVTGTHSVPVKADDISDFEVISIPEPKSFNTKETFDKFKQERKAAKAEEEAKKGPQPLPMPENHPFPHVWAYAEKMGVEFYDDGTVKIFGKVLPADQVINQAFADTQRDKIVAFGTSFEKKLKALKDSK